MKTQHTPGPWKLLTEGDEDTFIVRTIVIEGKSRNLSEVAFITTGSMSDDVEEANAKLIAAAPELLTSLDLMIRIAEYGVESCSSNSRPGEDREKHKANLLSWIETAKTVIKKATE